MVKEFIYGQMGNSMTVAGMKVNSMELAVLQMQNK